MQGNREMSGLGLTRSGLSKRTGCNIETIRYYEGQGLMPEPKRTLNGYRVYGEADVKRLSFIRRLRGLGFVLKEIRGLLGLVDGESYTCEEIHQVAVAHLDDVREKIADLEKIDGTLSRMAAKCAGGEVPDCPIIDDLYRMDE